jgi:hypothetical protein
MIVKDAATLRPIAEPYGFCKRSVGRLEERMEDDDRTFNMVVTAAGLVSIALGVCVIFSF